MELSRAGPGRGRGRSQDLSAVFVRLKSLDFFLLLLLFLAGVARPVNKFTKTKATNEARFLTYLNLLGASEAI